VRERLFRLVTDRRIATVLTAAMTLLIALTVALITVTDASKQRELARTKFEETGQFLARTLNDVVADLLYFRNIEALRNLSNVVTGQPEIEAFMVLDPEGRVLTSGGAGKYPVGQIELPDWTRTETRGGLVTRSADTNLEMLSPVIVNREVVGVLLFRFDRTPLEQELRAMLFQHLLQLLVVLALGSVVSYFLARILVQPVKGLIKLTQDITGGDLEGSVTSRGPGEIADLTRAIHEMALHLRETERTRTEIENARLRESHDALERSNLQLSSTLSDLESARDLLQAITSIQHDFIESAQVGQAFEELLATLLRITRSQYGFIGEIRDVDNTPGRLHVHAVSGIPWDLTTRAFYDRMAPSLAPFDLATLLDGPLAAEDTTPTKLPDGHPAVATFLGIPLQLGGQLVGQIGIANRDGGYSPELIRELEPLVSAVAQIMSGRRAAIEREGLRNQLYQAQKMESLGLLAGGIAHDFNNLLTAILGNTDLAMADLPETGRAQQHLQRIHATCLRAGDLAGQMLAYSGKGRFVVRAVDLSATVEDIAHLLEVSVAKKTRLRFALDPDLPPIKADVTQLSQVIMNLITNAAESIADGQAGAISLTTSVVTCDQEYLRQNNAYNHEGLQEGDYVSLEVSDSGSGMAPEIVARMFDPFFSTKLEGRGLGLAATLGIVRGHQGTIIVHSEVDKGTTIRCLLPASHETEITAPPPKRGDTSWQGVGTVLVVDDEDTVRTIIGEMIKALGFDLLTAVDGLEGIEVFKQHADVIDLVILDMSMPNVDGEEAFKEIQKIRPGARVVLTSGYTQQETIGELTGDGPSGFLQKPFGIATLRQQILEVLARERQTNEATK